MSSVFSFGAISEASARVLILGSMPGLVSLKANQYYAHPRNAFWRIMSSILGFEIELPYESRAELLKSAHIALWDVLHACVRPGSLDSAIEAGSRVPNDFQSFFRAHPEIQFICFNGAAAQRSFDDLVLPQIDRAFGYVRLPSTSPANTLSFQRKVDAWRTALIAIKNPDQC
jgi:double-stranded uracil-DNA glycosylase